MCLKSLVWFLAKIYKIGNQYIIKHGIHVCMPVCRLTAWCCECCSCTCSDLTPAPAPTSHILISPLVHTLSWFTVAMPGHHGEREYYLGCSNEKKRSMTCRIVEIISVWWVCWCGQRDQITFSMFKGWNSNKHIKLHCLHVRRNNPLSVCW